MANNRRIERNDKGNMKVIPYSRQWIDEKDINVVINILKGEWLTQGPTIEQFEYAIAEYCGAKYAVVFNSGTSALHGAYFAIGLGAGDEFITAPITFAATANAGLYLGAKPVFVDIEKDTGNIDSFKIESKISGKTKLIVPVHYAGNPADLQKIYNLAQSYNIPLIEDACHAPGAGYNGEKIGSCKYSEMTVFSFHPVKHITTGEGGAVLTNREEYYRKMLMFRSHGIIRENLLGESEGEWYYEMQLLGYNYRMTDIQAALGVSQLKKLDSFVEKRRKIASIYNEKLLNNSYFDIPPERNYSFSSYHLYPIRLKDNRKDKKKEIFSTLRKKGIGVQVHYIPVYLHPYYQQLGYKKGLCPKAEDFYAREISLPVYPAMEIEDAQRVISETLACLEVLR